jgi:hypothetical protein
MTQEQKNKEFARITGEMLELYSNKNELYGDSFNQLMHELGLIAGVVPLDNKLRRVKSIVKGAQIKYESLEDSLMDLANYSILMLIHLKELNEARTQVIGAYEEPTKLMRDLGYDTAVVRDIDPCQTCHKWNTGYGSIVDPCAGCPHNKNPYPTIMCTSTTGGTHEQ